VWRELLRESLILGAAGVVIGIPAGIGFCAALMPHVAATASLNYKLLAAAPELALQPATFVVAAAAGLLAALLAGVQPAWRAARVPVVETLARRGMEQRGAGTRAMAAVRGAAVALSAAALAVHEATGSAAWGLVATGLIVALAALAARPLVRLSRKLLPPTMSALAGRRARSPALLSSRARGAPRSPSRRRASDSAACSGC